MRHLNFIRETNNSAKLLDEILLLVGQIGEMIFSFGEKLSYSSSITLWGSIFLIVRGGAVLERGVIFFKP